MNLLSMSHIRKTSDLTPRAKFFYRTAKSLLATARKMEDQNLSNRVVLDEAAKVPYLEDFLKEKVNNVTAKFVQSQLQQQKKSRKGRRFTLDDKILALSLLKQSPRAYKVLQRIFALPSRKTLVSLLNQMPFNTGLNPQITESLKRAVEKMEPLDRYCCLMFDEMAVEPELQYNAKLDIIQGFEDVGTERRRKFADHATVFMVRGIRRKWKQPVCYYFTESGMKSVEIAAKIKEIVYHLKGIGLHIVATISDQAAANSAAINLLAKEGTTDIGDRLCYRIDGEDIFHLYDPPHLLKGE